MRCPRCRREDATKVINSRQRGDNRRFRKRRCADCKYEFVTTEVVGAVDGNHPLLPPLVVKKDGRTEPFNPEKLRQSIFIAVRKARRDNLPIGDFVDDIEREVMTAIDEPTETRHIGDQVMEKLRQHDAVAYLRYASIYRELDSEEDFRDLLNETAQKKKT